MDNILHTQDPTCVGSMRVVLVERRAETHTSISRNIQGNCTCWGHGSYVERSMVGICAIRSHPRAFSFALNEDISVKDFLGSTSLHETFHLPLSVQAHDEVRDLQKKCCTLVIRKLHTRMTHGNIAGARRISKQINTTSSTFVM